MTCKKECNKETIKNFTTKELVKELKNRDGVQLVNVEIDDAYFISVDDATTDFEIDDVGPAIILIVTK